MRFDGRNGLPWSRNFTVNGGFNQDAARLTRTCRRHNLFLMNGRKFTRALALAISAGALIFAGCSTTESRIKEHPEIFQSLSANDQALVSRGQIRTGMSQDAVWLAWGTADQRIAGAMRGQRTE